MKRLSAALVDHGDVVKVDSDSGSLIASSGATDFDTTNFVGLDIIIVIGWDGVW